jgi:hypothetical protein
MYVLNANDLLEKIGKVICFSETGQLGCIVQPNVNHLIHAGPCDRKNVPLSFE